MQITSSVNGMAEKEIDKLFKDTAYEERKKKRGPRLNLQWLKVEAGRLGIGLPVTN
jgi:hypothetical protein